MLSHRNIMSQEWGGGGRVENICWCLQIFYVHAAKYVYFDESVEGLAKTFEG